MLRERATVSPYRDTAYIVIFYSVIVVSFSRFKKR